MKTTTLINCSLTSIKVWILASTLLLSTIANAEEFQYAYPVTGSTAQELYDQFQNNALIPDGAFGYTKLNTKLDWSMTVDSHDICTVESVQFSYDITIYMPDWINKYEAKQCLQDSWAIVWNDIQLHEEHHRDLFRLLNPARIELRISAIEPKASCTALKQAVNSEVEIILQQNERLHDQFHAVDTPPTLEDC